MFHSERFDCRRGRFWGRVDRVEIVVSPSDNVSIPPPRAIHTDFALWRVLLGIVDHGGDPRGACEFPA
jgi:hypothetical protein